MLLVATLPWVKTISTQDIYRRMYAVGLAEELSISLLPSIANAAPSVLGAEAIKTVPLTRSSITEFPRIRSLASRGIGSNAYGFGSMATGTNSPLLLGNPHWYLVGPDRFYLAQLTIPGVLNVSGAGFLGSPVVQIGFNDNVAWSHTVSTAERAGFFELQLVQGDPLSYLYDGNILKMKENIITVQVRDSSGALVPVTRTLYKSKHGPMVSNPMLAWNENTAFALRNINRDNFRLWRNWLRWSEAKSLDEFITIQREEAAMPWVNTVAVGRGSSQAWYADIGAVPNISSTQMAQCATEMGKVLIKAGHLPPNTPFLDGSRSTCDWQNDPDSVQLGAIGPNRMPSLLRKDYVANMNNSYWLSNPQAPLTGYPAIFGTSGEEELSLRARMGHVMVQERFSGNDGYPGRNVSSEVIRQMALNSRVFSAERFKTQVLEQVCITPLVSVQRDVLKGELFVPERKVNLTEACTVLRAWDNTGNSDARGAHIWDGFWMRLLIERETQELFTVPFDSADPLNTPRELQANATEILSQALGATVLDLQHSGLSLNAKRGDYLYLTRGGSKVPLYGGCDEIGYFTISCNVNNLYEMDRGDVTSNSYLQVVSFPHDGVEAYVLLVSSLTDDPASPYYSDYTYNYSTKQWHRIPFTESQIKADPNYFSSTIQE
ncbi:penicillin acylase family protein [Xenorhabdus sp. PR6a]|uniref:penicillin acylase family protein n=1 Tax=Xenorhabdus sp. PR6a TaxID=3025877 RepID=UPI0023589C22|nr:penicillin acylase family protein [Xenorhabdus sp. PR6a]MDC9583238.1 penicillin acylase family protein [Xenorhabdus sp. PR6a]